MKKIISALTLSLLIFGCSHPLEPQGHGDILSESGNRNCYFEDAQADIKNCSQNAVTGNYQETYYAVPRKGWEFDGWASYCSDGVTGNQCSFDIEASLVNQFAGQTQPTLVAVFVPGDPDTRPPSRSFVVPLSNLERSKQAYLAGYPEAVTAVNRAIYYADRYLSVDPVSVVYTPHVAPSGDIHDYVDYKAYWWPNPDTEDGLPWIHRDGHINPDNYADFTSLQLLSGWTEALALPYYMTENESYAAKAGELLRTWFIDPATRMNPSNNYSQMEPHWEIGDYNVAGFGNRFPNIFDAAGIIESSTSWTAQDKAALQQWAIDFLDWVEGSEIAADQFADPANHGTNYDFLNTLLALYAEDYTRAHSAAQYYFEQRMPGQINPDGLNPYEIYRANNLLYHRYNLGRAMDLAQLTRLIPGFDGTNYTTSDGRGLKLAMEFLLPYMRGDEVWDKFPGETWPTEPDQYFLLMLRGAHLFHDAAIYQGVLDSNYTTVGYTPLTYPTYTLTINGDLDGDRRLNTQDHWIISSQLGYCSGDAQFYSPADFNNDGCVTNADYNQWCTANNQPAGCP